MGLTPTTVGLWSVAAIFFIPEILNACLILIIKAHVKKLPLGKI